MVESGRFPLSTVISCSSYTRTSVAEVVSLMSFPPSWSKITSGLILSTNCMSRWYTCGTVLPPTPCRWTSRLPCLISLPFTLIQSLSRLIKLCPRTSARIVAASLNDYTARVSRLYSRRADVRESSYGVNTLDNELRPFPISWYDYVLLWILFSEILSKI